MYVNAVPVYRYMHVCPYISLCIITYIILYVPAFTKCTYPDTELYILVHMMHICTVHTVHVAHRCVFIHTIIPGNHLCIVCKYTTVNEALSVVEKLT